MKTVRLFEKRACEKGICSLVKDTHIDGFHSDVIKL